MLGPQPNTSGWAKGCELAEAGREGPRSHLCLVGCELGPFGSSVVSRCDSKQAGRKEGAFPSKSLARQCDVFSPAGSIRSFSFCPKYAEDKLSVEPAQQR